MYLQKYFLHKRDLTVNWALTYVYLVPQYKMILIGGFKKKKEDRCVGKEISNRSFMKSLSILGTLKKF